MCKNKDTSLWNLCPRLWTQRNFIFFLPRHVDRCNLDRPTTVASLSHWTSIFVYSPWCTASSRGSLRQLKHVVIATDLRSEWPSCIMSACRRTTIRRRRLTTSESATATTSDCTASRAASPTCSTTTTPWNRTPDTPRTSTRPTCSAQRLHHASRLTCFPLSSYIHTILKRNCLYSDSLAVCMAFSKAELSGRFYDCVHNQVSTKAFLHSVDVFSR